MDKSPTSELPVRVRVDLTQEFGCLGILIIVAAIILGSSVELSGKAVAAAIDKYTAKVTTVSRTP